MPLLPEMSTDLLTRASRVTMLILDVDGVLTDGRIVYDEYGDELKFFDVQDGSGLMLWHRSGLHSAIVTARKGKLIRRRANELHVDVLVQKALKKFPVYEALLKRFRLAPEQVCAIGDDLMELPILRRVGLAVAVPNAVDEIQAVSHYITKHSGGRGAVREVVDLILKAKGLWGEVVKPYQV